MSGKGSTCSEFIVARTDDNRKLTYCFSLKSIGVPVEEPVWMLGDNQSVVTSSTQCVK